MKTFFSRLFFSSLGLFFVSNVDVSAETTELIVNRTVSPNFPVEKAYFLLITDDEVFKIPSQVVLEFGDESFFATSLVLDLSQAEVQQALLLYGKGGAMQFFPFQQQNLTKNIDGLKLTLEKLTKSLESWKTQIRVQGETVERLRGEAAVIGNIARITEKAAELEQVKRQQKHLDEDIENLKHFIALAGKAKQPRNFAKRHTTLNDQLQELAKKTKQVESAETKRKMMGEEELKQNIRLIEESRDDDYDDLIDSLKQLQQIRRELEDIYNN